MAISSTLKKVNGSSFGHSIGPVAVEYWDISFANGDTSGTVSSNLHGIVHVELTSFEQTALPSVSGSTITLAVADPGATRYGQLRVYGKK